MNGTYPLMINFDGMFKREPMDQEYEDQATGTAADTTLLMTSHSELLNLSTNTVCSSSPYRFPHLNLTMSQETRNFTKTDSYPGVTAHNGVNGDLSMMTHSPHAFKPVSYPVMQLPPMNSHFKGPLPSPRKSPTFLTQLNVATSIKVDGGRSEHVNSSTYSSVVSGPHKNSSSCSSVGSDLPHSSPSPPQRQVEIPSSTVDIKKKGTEDRGHGRQCQICNDHASGFHYGVWSCEGCKAFFKRSLQGPVDYVCPSTNSCTIDKQRRKSCQACRLRKCVEMGMSRGNCRKERKSTGLRGPKRISDAIDASESMGPSQAKLMRPDGLGSAQHYNEWESGMDPNLRNGDLSQMSFPSQAPASPPSTGISPSSPPSNHHRPHHHSSPSQSAVEHSSMVGHQQSQYSPHSSSGSEHSGPQQTVSGSSLVSGAASSSASSYRSAVVGSSHAGVGETAPSSATLIQESSSISTSQLSIDPLVEHLLRIDPPTRASGHDGTKCDSEMHLMTSLMRLADTELVDVINWAKAIPGYAELEFQDRVHLLELCWMEILILGILWRTLKNPDNTVLGDTFIMASDLIFDRSKFEEVNMRYIGSQLKGYLQEMSYLHLNQEEFVLLRALVLINSDRSDSESSAKISSLRSNILQALHYTTIQRYHGNVSKVMNLLTLLPHIRQLSQQWINHMVRCLAKDQLATYSLLKEMTDAYLKCTDYTTLCDTVTTSRGHRQSQDSRSSSVDSNGCISVSPSLSPQSDVNV